MAPRLGHTVGTMTIALWVIGVALVIVGLAGVVLPALPGTWLILAGLILAAAAEGFTRVGVITLVVIGVLGLPATPSTSWRPAWARRSWAPAHVRWRVR